MASFTEQAAARDLLAVVHRDGGHHREEHGIKSYKMAEAVVLQSRTRIGEAVEYIDEIHRKYMPTAHDHQLVKIREILTGETV